MFKLFSTFFDKRCLACGDLIHSPNGAACQSRLCRACHAALSPNPTEFCKLCGLPFPQGSRSSGLCPVCLAKRPDWSGFLSLGPYEGLLRQLVLDLKFHSALHIANLLGGLLASRLSPEQFDLVVPVPLHIKRLKERGYNQSLEIARQLAREMRIKIDAHSLVRVKHCPPQESLGKIERGKAVKGAFHSNNQFTGMNVLLVDDVMTTGATISECCQVLFAAGAVRVVIAVAARTGLN